MFIALIVAFSAGTFFGLCMMALFAAASNADRDMERYQNRDEYHN